MKVFEFIPDGVQDCHVTAWIQTKNWNSQDCRLNPAIIICPGGGYRYLEEREGEPLAKFYFAAGYNTFVLHYAVGDKAKKFYPLIQLAATISHIRSHSEEWVTAKSKIAVCGFSAGGHLAGSLGTLFNEERFLRVFNRQEDIRPNAMILGYPVITADEYAHENSLKNVSGEEVGSAGYMWFGLDQHVDNCTPPTFLWHTSEDTGVPVENSLKMGMALSRENVPFELHVLPHGRHGLSVCTQETGLKCEYNGRWVEWSIKWLNKLFEDK